MNLYVKATGFDQLDDLTVHAAENVALGEEVTPDLGIQKSVLSDYGTPRLATVEWREG